MKREKVSWFYISFWVFFLILVLMLLTRLFGHSATEIQIMLAMFGMFFGSITELYRRNGNLESEVKTMRKEFKEELIKINRKLKI